MAYCQIQFFCVRRMACIQVKVRVIYSISIVWQAQHDCTHPLPTGIPFLLTDCRLCSIVYTVQYIVSTRVQSNRVRSSAHSRSASASRLHVRHVCCYCSGLLESAAWQSNRRCELWTSCARQSRRARRSRSPRRRRAVCSRISRCPTCFKF